MTQNRRKPRIQTKNKSYPLQDSPLFKLTTKRKLAKIIFSELAELKQLCNDNNYSCFTKITKGKTRLIQAPLRRLDMVHTRIASLLCRIDVPNELHSGTKGCSIFSNAKAHLGGGRRTVTVDIKSFFKSTSRSQVFDFFSDTMKCAPDVADLLSRLLTFNDHIPTGSRVSMPMAYFANQKMFCDMQAVADARGATMTIYVDDLTFSGTKLNRQFVDKISTITEKYKHTLHPDKTRFYGPKAAKSITGTVIVGNELRPRNCQYKAVHEDMQNWLSTDNPDDALAARLLGRISFIGNFDARFKDKAVRFRRAL
jgi:hypothetical protein